MLLLPSIDTNSLHYVDYYLDLFLSKFGCQ